MVKIISKIKLKNWELLIFKNAPKVKKKRAKTNKQPLEMRLPDFFLEKKNWNEERKNDILIILK
mgnify:CR=1 FL=1